MMSRFLPLLATLLLGTTPALLHAQSDAEALAHARRLLESHPLVDGHNDLPWEIRTQREHPMDVEAYDLRKTTPGHTDLARLREGRVGAQFWSIYVPGEAKDSGYARIQLEEFDIARRMIARYPELLVPAYSADDIEKAFREHKIGSLLGMEGGHVLENSLGALRVYYDLGARYLTLTHNVTLDWADAASDSAKHGGLTDFGRDVVREMNRLGMLVDLSHVSPGTMSDVLDVTRAPVIFSHSSARALTDHVRNVPDSILKRLPANGGVVMVTFVPGFISTAIMEYEQAAGEFRRGLRAVSDSTERRARWDEWRNAHPRPQATIDDVADHIEHVRDVADVANVGIGSDFDGITETPVGLEDVSKFPALFAELIQRGWSDEDLAKLAGGNVLRALRAAEAVADK
jgi:membrane dipeptidase